MKKTDGKMLNRAIGQIDEAFVAEALTYKKKRNIKPLLGVVGAAAAVVIAFTLMWPEVPPQTDAPSTTVTVDMHDGKGKLVIQDEEGEIVFVTLTLDETERLMAAASEVGEPAAEDTGKRIWVCDEHGRAVSPELYPSEGNVGYGVLFDYIPECTPGEEFTALMNEIVNGGK